MCDNQIPLFRNIDDLAILIQREPVSAVYYISYITKKMPFGMPAGALLDVAAIRLMASRPKRFADFLAFLASYQYIQSITSFLVGWLVIGKVNPAVRFGDFFRTTLLPKRVIRHHFNLLRFDHVVMRFL